jgi:hypothetical protein
MHNAPTVSYPVGRSHFQAWLAMVMLLTALITQLAWFTQALWGWRQGFMGVAFGLAVALALFEWRRSLQGTIAWDGVVWRFNGGQQPVIGQVLVRLDFQFMMLLTLTPLTGQRLWLWAERRRDAARWLSLRRAAFSRPVDPLSQTSHAVTPVKSETA